MRPLPVNARETFVDRRPQLITQQRLGFLYPVHALRTDDEAGVHIRVVREGAAVVAGETDGVQAR